MSGTAPDEVPEMTGVCRETGEETLEQLANWLDYRACSGGADEAFCELAARIVRRQASSRPHVDPTRLQVPLGDEPRG